MCRRKKSEKVVDTSQKFPKILVRKRFKADFAKTIYRSAALITAAIGRLMKPIFK